MNADKLHIEFLKAYEKFADAIFRHCYFRISDRERAEELTQDTFMRTWDYIAKGNTIENIQAFLYRTAGNLIIDEYKKNKTVSLDQMVDAGFQPPVDKENWNDILDAKQLVSCLSKVEEPYRTAVIMRYLDDLYPKEIAAVNKSSANVVSVHITRGLEKLRKLFPSL